jgi:hypothetical protein
MPISPDQRLELLRTAQEKAGFLLEGLQREVKTVRGFTGGERVFDNAIDAVRGTLDNLNRAVQGGPSSE